LVASVPKNSGPKYIVLYRTKQKVSYDSMRRNAMNQQLVQLVQQTEKYTALLGMTTSIEHSPTNLNDVASGRNPRVGVLTIEQALANTETRRGKHRVKDYTRLLHEVETTDGEITAASMFGESAEDSGSDASYTEGNGGIISSDDESTLRAAETEERRERHAKQKYQDGDVDPNYHDDDDATSFVADPIELRKLQEEADMDIDEVLERLRVETVDHPIVDDVLTHHVRDEDQVVDQCVQITNDEDNLVDMAAAMVKTAASATPVPIVLQDATGSDADDDMDASDVEDYYDNCSASEDDDEYVTQADEVDDETTMEQEELLPPDMSAADEIKLLQQENELTVEELRQRCTAAFASSPLDGHADDDDDDPMTSELEKMEKIAMQSVSNQYVICIL
jgi:hypothetical protein